MIKSVKNRPLYKGLKVKVYYNLHKKTFSIADYKTGLVVGHGDCFTLTCPTFKVSETGRQRVLREKKKNVHAYVIGLWEGESPSIPNHFYNWQQVYYNPYTVTNFMSGDREANTLNYHTVFLGNKSIIAGYDF